MLGTRSQFPHPFLVLATLAVSLMLAQCDRSEVRPVDAKPALADPEPAPDLASPTALTRAGLLAETSRAASAYAAGERPEGPDPLVGRPFALRVPFGCDGPPPTATAGDGVAHWSWGPENRTIRLTLTPGDWLNTGLISSAADGSAWEAVEGFWIPRPWLSAAACSSIRADPLQSGGGAPAPQTVGLAAVFTAEDSRVGRRNGRAYAFTIRPTGDTPLAAPENGYRLVLEGRLASFPDGRAIRCRAGGPDQRPVCIAAIRLDRVAFTSADSSVLLSEWRPG